MALGQRDRIEFRAVSLELLLRGTEIFADPFNLSGEQLLGVPRIAFPRVAGLRKKLVHNCPREQPRPLGAAVFHVNANQTTAAHHVHVHPLSEPADKFRI